MFKRIFWLAVGIAVGLAFGAYIRRRVRDTVDRYKPERISADVQRGIRKLGDDVKGSVADGREHMREREAALRAQLEGASRN